MLSVALDSAGWSVVTPPAGARVIYCSSSTGSDSNSGLSPSSPVKTLAKGESLLENHTGDQMLLKAGDVFYGNFIFWTLSGQSAQIPMVLGSYGTGARPEIMTGTQDGLKTGSAGAPEVDFLDIIGINFHANGRDPNMTGSPAAASNPSGIDILTRSNGILIENCEFQYYTVDVTFQNYLGPISNVSLRRNIIIDAYGLSAHAQGLYAYGVANLTITGNLFDHNGYNAQVPGANPTVFNQDCYVSANDSNCVIEDNIFSRAASTGLEDRPGGLVEDNLFLNDPVGLNFGLVNGAETTTGGVTGQVSGNVFIGGGNIGNLPEGQALCVGNIKPGAGALISDNIFTQGGAGSAPAVTLEPGKSQIDPQNSVGINDLTFASNVFDDWSTGFDMAAGMSAGGSGLTAFNRVDFLNNQFENLTGPSVENHSGSYLGQETFNGNSFYNSGQWIINGAKSAIQGTTLTTPMAFPSPDRSVSTYDASLGNSGTIADFLAIAAQQSEASWDSNYEGAAVTAYFDQGFNVGSTTIVSSEPTTPVVTTQPTNRSATTGSTATFTAAASGNPTPTVQWQISTNAGNSFTNIAGATRTTYSFAAAASQSGYEYRAVFTNKQGSATTNPATLAVSAVLAAPTITIQPTSQSASAGTTATFTAAASGNPTPTVQWQISTNAGRNFTNIAGATSATYTFTASGSQGSYEYRAVFTNKQGSATTQPATLTPSTGLAPATNLKLVSQTSTAITVSWKASTSQDIAGYNIYRDGVAIDWVAGGGTTTYTDSQIAQLTPGAHQYTVVAVQSATVTSPHTAPLTVTIKGQSAPAAPTNLKLVSQSSTAVTISWTASISPSVTGYDIYRDGVAINFVGYAITTYTDSQVALLSPGAHRYTIVAVDVANNKSPQTAALNVIV